MSEKPSILTTFAFATHDAVLVTRVSMALIQIACARPMYFASIDTRNTLVRHNTVSSVLVNSSETATERGEHGKVVSRKEESS